MLRLRERMRGSKWMWLAVAVIGLLIVQAPIVMATKTHNLFEALWYIAGQLGKFAGAL
jgi:bacteriorhodopsin